MSIIYNDTEIENIIYDNINVDSVFFLNTEVFSGTKTLTVNIGTGISSIVINGTTYSLNTTVNIKPGTTVTLDCNIRGNNSSDRVTYTYSFVNWTGYTTNTSKSFTFTMPSNNITYTANGTYSTSFNWPSGNIPEATFLNAINNGFYDTSLVGRYVTLKEDSSTHNWLIIQVNSNTYHDSYDLWYKGSIGTAKWSGTGFYRRWDANDFENTNLVRGLCHSYKSKLSSSIQAKLKTVSNVNCIQDKVGILSAKQLGLNDDHIKYESPSNKAIPYFNSNDRRKLGTYYWTTTANSFDEEYLWIVWHDGSFNFYGYYNYDQYYLVVPTIRVG